MVSVWFGEHVLRHGGGRWNIAAGQLCLGKIKTRQWARLAVLQNIFVADFVELDLARTVHLLIHIHAVHHFADSVFQAGRILFKLRTAAHKSIA